MSKPSPKLLLFDLGGVVLPWVGPERLAASHNLKRSDVIARFEASEIFNAYECGHVDDDTFLRELDTMFDLKTDDVAKLWNSWVHPPFPGVIDAIKNLKPHYPLACLSNTNALHWAHVNRLIDTTQLFHYAFASHLIGAAKPDRQSYQIVLDKIGVEASDIWFFEDTTVNVKAAREFGMTVHQIDRRLGVLQTLKDLGLLR